MKPVDNHGKREFFYSLLSLRERVPIRAFAGDAQEITVAFGTWHGRLARDSANTGETPVPRNPSVILCASGAKDNYNLIRIPRNLTNVRRAIMIQPAVISRTKE